MGKLRITKGKPDKRWGEKVFEVTKDDKPIGYVQVPNGKRKAGG